MRNDLSRSRRPAVLWAALWALLTITAAAPHANAAAGIPVPRGYTIASLHVISPTLTHVQYRSSIPRRVVNVAFLRKGAPEHLRTVLSNERVIGGTETVRSMCIRVKCVVAVNGDFFEKSTGQPTGGVALEGIAVRTPPSDRYHFTQDANGDVAIQKIFLAIRMTVDYPGQGPRPFHIHSVNTGRQNDRAVIYTPRWSGSTQVAGGFEVALDVADPVELDKPLRVAMRAASTDGNMPIASKGMVLSTAGTYASALWNIWQDVQAGLASPVATITFDSQPDLRTYTGGSPPLLLAGEPAFVNNGSLFVNQRAPRTMVGINGARDSIIAQVDGRRADWSVGMSIPEASQFMRSLGADDALNLDGGGSSTFVKNPYVVSWPSDGRERGVATSLAILR